MKDAADYIAHVRMLIVQDTGVVHWSVVREEAQGDWGLFRYRLYFPEGGQLEALERFEVVEGEVQVAKYSFHWQDGDGQLIQRWDNAAHHPEIKTHPDHVHVGKDNSVLPHEPVNLEKVMGYVSG